MTKQGAIRSAQEWAISGGQLGADGCSLTVGKDSAVAQASVTARHGSWWLGCAAAVVNPSATGCSGCDNRASSESEDSGWSSGIVSKAGGYDCCIRRFPGYNTGMKSKLRTNVRQVVMLSVQGKVSYPSGRRTHGVDAEGRPFLLPSIGGITYNVKVGDPAFGWAGDHIEPGVSCIADWEKRMDHPNTSLHFYSCIGNQARVVTGAAQGAIGVVTGHHGGAEHVLIDFPDAVLEKLQMEDKFLIKGWGQGLQLLDYPEIQVLNLDPDLLTKMGVVPIDNAKIEVPVAAIVPGYLMGSGIGSTSMGTGDYDVMTADRQEIARLGLDRLRFGDIVAITDHDNLYGRSWRKGAITIGVIVHSDCVVAGHGPGVTTIMSASRPLIVPRLEAHANIAEILKIGRFRSKSRR